MTDAFLGSSISIGIVGILWLVADFVQISAFRALGLAVG
jgi:hypothetical protein